MSHTDPGSASSQSISSYPATWRSSEEANPEDVAEFVNLDGTVEVFEISDVADRHYPWHRVHSANLPPVQDDPNPTRFIWYGKAEDRLDEMLFLICGDRWVLVYSPLEREAESSLSNPPTNRELTAKEACTWIRWVNGYKPPTALRDFNTRRPGYDPARLERAWKPDSPQQVGQPSTRPGDVKSGRSPTKVKKRVGRPPVSAEKEASYLRICQAVKRGTPRKDILKELGLNLPSPRHGKKLIDAAMAWSRKPGRPWNKSEENNRV
jgi:hypothetical protein